MVIPKGFCQCGCGGKTNIATHTRRNQVLGEPLKFIYGHSGKIVRREDHPRWKGGISQIDDGYIKVLMPEHPRAHPSGYVYEHILIAEKALGKPLPPGADVHHPNGKKGDNSRVNHVICQDGAYHNLLHRRERAYRACGRANWRKCKYCKQYDDPANMRVTALNVYHKACASDYNRKRYADHAKGGK